MCNKSQHVKQHLELQIDTGALPITCQVLPKGVLHTVIVPLHKKGRHPTIWATGGPWHWQRACVQCASSKGPEMKALLSLQPRSKPAETCLRLQLGKVHSSIHLSELNTAHEHQAAQQGQQTDRNTCSTAGSPTTTTHKAANNNTQIKT